ncbi:MAG: EVE domain-containing protein [Acidobacteriota bacterium]
MQPRESEMNYWLFATDPADYSFADLERDESTVWNGVADYVAQKNLRDVEQGDMALILHQGSEPAIVGVARVISDAYPDPAQDDATIHVVDLEPVERLEHAIPLSALLDEPDLQDWELVENPEMEVAEVPAPLWERLIAISREGLVQSVREA